MEFKYSLNSWSWSWNWVAFSTLKRDAWSVFFGVRNQVYNFPLNFCITSPYNFSNICYQFHHHLRGSAIKLWSSASFWKEFSNFQLYLASSVLCILIQKKHNKILPKRSRINFSLCEEGEKNNMRNSSASSHRAGSHLHRVSHTSTL